MSTQHTPGPIELVGQYRLVAVAPIKSGTATEPVFEASRVGGMRCLDEAQANARRLVACWNACEGISTENLEDNMPVKDLSTRYNAVLAQRDELLAACKAMLACCYDLERNDETLAAVKTTMAAIYKATGEMP